MSSRIGYFLGMALADLHHLVRGRQAVPCLVDWENEPDGDPDVTDGLTPSSRPKRSGAVGLNADPTNDCCPDYEVDDCCLITDTIGEFEGKA